MADWGNSSFTMFMDDISKKEICMENMVNILFLHVSNKNWNQIYAKNS